MDLSTQQKVGIAAVGVTSAFVIYNILCSENPEYETIIEKKIIEDEIIGLVEASKSVKELKKEPEPHKEIEAENNVKIEEPAETVKEIAKEPEPHKEIEVENDVKIEESAETVKEIAEIVEKKIEEPAETVKEIAEIVEPELGETAVEEIEEQKPTSDVSELAEAAMEQTLVTENELRYEKMEKFYDQIKQKSFPNTVDVTFKEIEKMGENCILIDCRSKEEREFSMLLNAVTKEEFIERKYEFLAKSMPIIPYCAIGGRSGKYAKELKELFEECDIYNYKGSFIDWCHNDGELVTSHGKPTKEVFIGNLEDYYPVDTDYIYEKEVVEHLE